MIEKIKKEIQRQLQESEERLSHIKARGWVAPNEEQLIIHLKGLIDYIESLENETVKDTTHLFTPEEVREIAKHFFELGLKAQHDNWKVVDNVNPPQADKNKIYCVLSKKNKYLLAKVINHPQDEDLLQWKCTEFPFHRYDMCEGDKYMQIV